MRLGLQIVIIALQVWILVELRLARRRRRNDKGGPP